MTDLPRVALHDLPSLLRLTRLGTRWLLPLELDLGPGLPGRIRGAWGDRLRVWTEAGTRDAAEARALFFPDKAGGSTGNPVPFVVAADVLDNELQITLTLIGMAHRWRTVAFDAFVAALSTWPGLALTDVRHARRRQLHLLSAATDRIAGLPERPVRPFEFLDFLTPFKIGPSNALGGDFRALVFSLAERPARLAVYENLDVPWTPSVWRDLARAQRFETSRLRAVSWQRWSSRRGQQIMSGYVGRLQVVQPSEEMAPLLTLGSFLHAGAQTAFGLGRFVL